MKRILSCILAITMIFTLASCSTPATVMTIDGTVIKPGMYIFLEFDAINLSQNDFKEKNKDVDTTVEGFDYFKQNVGDVPMIEYMESKTLEACKRYVAVNKSFDEAKLSFTADEIKGFNDNINKTWDDENESLSMYYGIKEKSWGEYYEKAGVSKASYKELVLSSEKAKKLFNYYYGKDGTEAVPQGDLDNYIKENYARVRLLQIPLVDKENKATTDEALLKEYEALANEYVKQLNDGKSFLEVNAAFTKYSNDFLGKTEEAPKKDEEPKTETEADHDYFVEKSSESPSKAFVESIFKMKEDKKAQLIKEKDTYYVVLRDETLGNTTLTEKYTDTVLHNLRDDTFDAKLKALGETFTVDSNKAAIDAFAPNTLRQ